MRPGARRGPPRPARVAALAEAAVRSAQHAAHLRRGLHRLRPRRGLVPGACLERCPILDPSTPSCLVVCGARSFKLLVLILTPSPSARNKNVNHDAGRFSTAAARDVFSACAHLTLMSRSSMQGVHGVGFPRNGYLVNSLRHLSSNSGTSYPQIVNPKSRVVVLVEHYTATRCIWPGLVWTRSRTRLPCSMYGVLPTGRYVDYRQQRRFSGYAVLSGYVVHTSRLARKERWHYDR